MPIKTTSFRRPVIIRHFFPVEPGLSSLTCAFISAESTVISFLSNYKIKKLPCKKAAYETILSVVERVRAAVCIAVIGLVCLRADFVKLLAEVIVKVSQASCLVKR